MKLPDKEYLINDNMRVWQIQDQSCKRIQPAQSCQVSVRRLHEMIKKTRGVELHKGLKTECVMCRQLMTRSPGPLSCFLLWLSACVCADFSLCSETMFAIICCFASVSDLHSARSCRCTVVRDIFKPICPRSSLTVKVQDGYREGETDSVKSNQFPCKEYLQRNKFWMFPRAKEWLWFKQDNWAHIKQTSLVSSRFRISGCPSLSFFRFLTS